MYTLIVKCLLLCTLCVNAVPQFREKCTLGTNIDEFINCVSIRSLKALDQARQRDIVLLPGVVLKRDSVQRSAKQLNFELPQNLTDKTKLLDALYSASARFISGRTLKVDLPLNISSKNVARTFEEGRAKMKKMMGSLLLGFGTRMMSMVPLMFGGLLFLTTKALIVGKLAFIISALLFIQMFSNGRGLFSYGGTYNIPPTYGVPTTYGTNFGTNFGTNTLGGWGTSGQYPYARSIDVESGSNEGTV
ncbi:uncharacterized protein LOC135136267 [Zophobas morio]|uniref:uncharacterized protein LOC135136267 n=1 Tax=Zophobas morio TaxID=2755281 RepID=UPI0030826CA7